MFFLRSLFTFSLFLFFLSSCNRPPSTTPSSSSPLSFPSSPRHSCSSKGSHAIFSILVDGADVGREVRTDIVENGPSISERFILSHSVKNEKMGKVLFQTVHVRTERSDALSGRILNTSFVKKDQVSTQTISIRLEKERYLRTISTSSHIKHGVSDKSDVLSLTDVDSLGFRLIDIARKVSLGDVPPPSKLSYFDAKLNSPVFLSFSSSPSSITIDGQVISGRRVVLSNIELREPMAEYFFDSSGILWSEKYPDLHEERIRLVGSFSLPSDSSELIVGLHSNSYIYDPNIASRATYHLTSTPDRLDKLDMLEDPLNQTVRRLSDNKLELTVHSGSPDADTSPVDSDLGSSFYIRPFDPVIKNALLYLKSSGKRGSLPEKRRLNVTPIIARVSIIDKPRSFWSDNDKVASIIMHYVSSLLPDKRHTFSMSDAVESLSHGAGDCTEHAVLFASLMRAHGIPTRLVTGMLLMPGGMWAYHMWNSYWDGFIWQSIDPSTKTYRPGALYVSLGRGASVFKDVRDRLSDFMWRTFSGVSFDLVYASNEGESLFLARPVGADRDSSETALFNAVVLSERGDHIGALSLLDQNISESSRSLPVKLMRIELLIKSERFESALEHISALRSETSLDLNTSLLDLFEFHSLLYIGDFNGAKNILSKIISSSDSLDEHKKTLLKSELLFHSGNEKASINLIQNSLVSLDPSSDYFSEFLNTFALYVSKIDNIDSSFLKKAYLSVDHSLKASHFVDPSPLSTASILLSRLGFPVLASWYLDHALTLSPYDIGLRKLHHRFNTDFECSIPE